MDKSAPPLLSDTLASRTWEYPPHPLAPAPLREAGEKIQIQKQKPAFAGFLDVGGLQIKYNSFLTKCQGLFSNTFPHAIFFFKFYYINTSRGVRKRATLKKSYGIRLRGNYRANEILLFPKKIFFWG